MESSPGSRKIKITTKELKGLHRFSRSLIKDLLELKKDPLLSRRHGVVQQLDEAIQNARDTKETLREIYIRESAWSKGKMCHKSTQTSQAREKVNGPNNKQWDTVGQLVDRMNHAISVGSDRLDIPLINESISHRHHEWWCGRSNQHLVPTMNHWIDTWAEERASPSHNKERKPCNRLDEKTADADEMVAHFQKLFDVPKRDGVYSRLNDVYNRLGELMNVLHVLKDMLGLDKDEPVSRVVAVVKRLCDLHSDSSTNLLRYLLQADDLDRMILRIDEYNKFFPVFERVTKELMMILEVDSLNHLIPAVKALKLLQP